MPPSTRISRRAARESEEATACAEVPEWRAESGQCRDKGDPVARRDRRGQRFALGRVSNETKVVTQPLDARTGGQDDPFNAPREHRVVTAQNNGKAARVESGHG